MTFPTGARRMRAVVVSRHGGGEVLHVDEVPIPEPGPTELLVRVDASGVNFMDVYQREGIYPVEPPFVLGAECAGQVAAVGSEVRDFRVDDLVATAAGKGTHATFAIVPAHSAVAVPDGMSTEVAAAAMLQGITAHFLVNSTYRVREGETVLVHAAAGGVGQLLVQLAKAKGARVIATAGSQDKAAVARERGADEVIRYDEVDDISAAVRALAPHGVDVAYDGVGKATFDASLASLRRRGMLVLFGAASGQVPPFEIQRLNSGGSLYLTRPTIAHYVADREELLWRSGDVLRAIAEGTLTVHIGGRYNLDQVQRAYADLEGRTTVGKLLIVT